MSSWREITDPPKRAGVYLVLAPSADPKLPHVDLVWYEPPGTGNLTGWQNFDIILQAWGGEDALTHWMDWRDGLPTRKEQMRARDKRKRLKKQRERAAEHMAKGTGPLPDFIGDKTATTQCFAPGVCKRCGLVEELGSHNPDDHDPHNFDPMET